MKSIKSLIIPAAILLALIVVAVVYFVVPKKENEEDKAISNDSVSVLNISNSEISRFTVDKKEGDAIVFTSELDSESGSQTWFLEGSDMEISQSAVSSYVSILSSYVANSTIYSVADVSEYSLVDPDFTITIDKFDGTSAKIFIGSYTFDNDGVYFMIEGDENVYITAKLKREYCEYTLTDFASTKILELDFADIESVEFKRSTDGADLVAVPEAVGDSYEHPNFSVISPVSCPANENFEKIIEFIASLEISKYEDISEAELASFGLAEPAFEFIYTMNDGSEITVSLSSNLSGKYYGTCSETDGYFSISELQFNGVETPVMSLLDSYIAKYDAPDVSSVTGTYGDESFEFVLNIRTSFTDDGAAATLNGRNAFVSISEGGRTYASILFESIVGMQYSGIDADADPVLDPALSYSIVTSDYAIVNIDFVDRGDGSYYVFIDGEYTGFYVMSSVLFADGEDDPYGYGSWAAYELTVEAIEGSINGVYMLPVSNDSTGEADSV